jgi:hypothetical protein
MDAPAADDGRPPSRRARRRAAARALMLARLGKPSILEALPATAELRPAAEIGRFVRLALAAAALSLAVLVYIAWADWGFAMNEEEPLSDYLLHLADLALSDWMLLPAGLLLLSGLLQMLRRRQPEWVRISLSREEAMVEGPGGTWTTPIAAFSAVAVRKRPGFAIRGTNQTTNVNRRIQAGRTYALLERETLWWVELVHPDPERSLPVWAHFGDFAGPGAERAARGFAQRFGLPLETLGTSATPA